MLLSSNSQARVKMDCHQPQQSLLATDRSSQMEGVEGGMMGGVARNNGSGSSSPVDLAPFELDSSDASLVLQHILSGQLLVVNKRRRNGLILYKQFHAEFAGPGAAVGGVFDKDCQQVIPVGSLSLITPVSHEERQEAYLIRRQWIRLTQQFTDTSSPLQRAQLILNQFENYFDTETIARIPDEPFSLLVGVLPNTIRMARRTPGVLNVKVKT